MATVLLASDLSSLRHELRTTLEGLDLRYPDPPEGLDGIAID